MRYTVLALLAALLPNASADTVLFSSFGTTVYGGSSSYANYVGTTFDTVSAGNLDSIVFEAYANPGPASSWPAGLYADAGGEPGALLESWTVSVPDNSDPLSITTIQSTTHPFLSSGTPYWFVLQDTSLPANVAWETYYGTVGGIWIGSSLNYLVQVDSNYPMAAIEVDAVPEPTSGLPVGVGCAALLMLRATRNRLFRRVR